MADGVSFAGDGKQDVSNEMPKFMDSASMSEGGPVSGGPDTNKGMTAPEGLKQTDGVMPAGEGSVKFAGDVGK